MNIANWPILNIKPKQALLDRSWHDLKKTPAEKVKTKHQIPPEKWEVIYGEYKSNLRLCFLPLDENTKCGYWFGFETEIQRTFPVFKAKTDI